MEFIARRVGMISNERSRQGCLVGKRYGAENALAMVTPVRRFALGPYRSFKVILLPAVGVHRISVVSPALRATPTPGAVIGFCWVAAARPARTAKTAEQTE